MTAEELQNKLSCSRLLSGFPLKPDEVKERRFATGRFISDRPGGVPSVGLVLEGRVVVYLVAPDGKDVQLNLLFPGEAFGICNLLLDAELETLLRCQADTLVLYVPKSVLISYMKKNADLSLDFARICDTKIQFLIRRIELLTMQSCRGRLAAYLLDEADEMGLVRLAGSRDDFARELGISRTALFRELSAMQSCGAIKTEGSVIAINKKNLLEKWMRGGSDC